MKKIILLAFCLANAFYGLSQIKADSSKRYLIDSTGKPFFWLGDTGWELFHRLTREEAIHYLDLRQKQGFNIIQAVVLAEMDGIKEPNRYGDKPFNGEDPTDWAITAGSRFTDDLEYDYWDHVRFIISEAAKRNLYIGLLPTWGDKVTKAWGVGPVIFNENNAFTYAKMLALQFQDHKNIIWILGGDRDAVYNYNVNGQQVAGDDRQIWRAMAKGIREVLGNEVFITFHASGGMKGTTNYFLMEPWLSMHSFQSGHGDRRTESWNSVRSSLLLDTGKPVLDMEPAYEDHPVNPWDGKWTRKERGFFSDYDVRARIYRSVFAGGAGITYGHHAIWQFLDTANHPAIFFGDTIITWQQALHTPAANQVKFLKQLFEDRDDWQRSEDSLLIIADRGKDYKDLKIATKQIAGNWAMIYLPKPDAIKVDLDRMAAGPKKAWWLNPSNGKKTAISKLRKRGIQTFTPPHSNKDWVLVIERL